MGIYFLSHTAIAILTTPSLRPLPSLHLCNFDSLSLSCIIINHQFPDSYWPKLKKTTLTNSFAKKGNLDFASDPWPSISSSAKDFVNKMLQSDPKERLSATEVLNHPWIREDGDVSDKPIDIAVLSRMKQLRAMNKLKKVALKVIVENLSEEEIVGLKEMFKSIDTDNSGTVTFEELKAGLPKLGTKLSESEVRQLMEAALEYLVMNSSSG